MECSKEISARHYQMKRETVLKRAADSKERRAYLFKKRRHDNREKFLAKEAEHRKRYREYLRKYWREYYEKNREVVNARIKQKRHADLAAFNASVAARHAANPLIKRFHTATRRARKVNATVPLTEKEKLEVREIYRMRDLMKRLTGEAYEVDHIIPLARGGKHHPNNLQVITALENRSKGARCKV